MSQQPGTCPRTTYELGLTWLAARVLHSRPRRRAYFIHGGGGSTRPTRHGISSGQRKAPPPSQGARCDEPTKGTNHRAAGLSSSAGGLLLAPSDAIGHYSLSTVKSLKNLRRRA